MTVVKRNKKQILKLIISALWLSVLSSGIYLLWLNYSSNIHYKPVQDTEFSHKIHSSKFGIRCISCHTGAEKSQVAGIPSIEDCMSCHIMLKYESSKLEKIVDSYENLNFSKWTKIYDIPDYVNYDHSIHIQAGIDCASCHGEVENTDTLSLTNNHEMKWCVACHKNPMTSIIVTREISGIYLNKFSKIHLGLDSAIKDNITKGKITCSGCHY